MKKITILLLMASIGLISCSENNRAKVWGGTMKVELSAGQKLVDVTWKENSLWYMTKPMNETDVAERYEFVENSNWGVVEGKVIFIETK